MTTGALLETDLEKNPFAQFNRWYEDAKRQQPNMHEAMTVSTCGSDGIVSSRVSLLKSFDGRGFVFYTNYNSRKAAELEETGRAALLFYWPSLVRQVRVEGMVEKVDDDESDAYFATRPVESRWSVYASPQSERIESRRALEARYDEVRERYGDQVPRPEWWGGYRVVPDEFEFWQGRESRLHDRLQYRLAPGGTWVRERLAP